MGARGNLNRIELILSSAEFNRRVGMVTNFYDLWSLGLRGHDFCGSFTRHSLAQLEAFCARDSEYHIVTCDGPGRRLNRLIHGKDYYMIANGDNDPALALNYLLDPNWPLSYEDGISSALAALDDIKNDRDS